MRAMPRPLTSLETPLLALFCSLDVLTTGGRVEPSTYAQLEALAEAIPIFVVTRRPAGWGHALASVCGLPVVSENGAVLFLPNEDEPIIVHLVEPETVAAWSERTARAVADVCRAVPGVEPSSDNAFRRVDRALTWRGAAPAGLADAEARLRGEGFEVRRSSRALHVGPPGCTRERAVRQLVEKLMRSEPGDLSPYLYVGADIDDDEMFGIFEHSVAAGDLAGRLDALASKPAYVVDAAGGAAIRAVAAHLLSLYA